MVVINKILEPILGDLPKICLTIGFMRDVDILKSSEALRKLMRSTCFLVETFSGFFSQNIFWGFQELALVDFVFLNKNCHYLFFKRWSSLCLHFCMISVRLFRDFSLSAYIFTLWRSSPLSRVGIHLIPCSIYLSMIQKLKLFISNQLKT